MSDSIAAPTGADVQGASSSATTKPASAGLPSKNDLTKAFSSKRAEKAKTEPASPVDAKQPAEALGAAEPGKKTEGDTARLDAGKGDDKPNEKKERDGDLPSWVKERLGKEKGRREKLEADLAAERNQAAKTRHLFEVAVAENERLTEALRTGAAYDERGEELQSLKVQQAAKERFAQMEQEHRQALAQAQREQQVTSIAEQLRSEVNAACAEYPLVSPAEVRASLRDNPQADIRELAKAKHEERMAFIAKQGGQRAAEQPTPTTVAKPSGAAKFQPPLNAKGMAQAFGAARAKR